MQKLLKTLRRMIPGFLCSVIAVFGSCLLIRRLDAIFHWIGNISGIEEQLLLQLKQVLVQLRQAELSPAWLPVVVVGTAAGSLLGCLRRKAGMALGTILLLLLLTLLATALTSVNGIKVWALLKCFLPMLPNL